MNELSVFGGTGFIGSRFCDLYSENTIRISREHNSPVTNEILYLISTTNNYHVFDDPTLDIKTNLLKLINVLQECKGKDVIFNFISSWFVYGDVELPVRENVHCNPKGFYSITKRTAEQLLVSYCQTFDIKYRILRLSNVIGAGDQDVSKKKNALQYLIEEIRENRNINLYYGGEFLRDYTYVDDICRGINLCINKAPTNSIINVGNGEALRFYDLMNYCREKLESTSEFNTVEPSDFHKIVQVKDMYLDTTKLKKLGYKPQYTIYEALDKLL